MQIGIKTLVILCASAQCLFAAPAKGQPIGKVEIQLELKNETLVQAFQKIEAQTTFHFMYNMDDVKNIRNLYMSSSKKSIESFLKILLNNTPLEYYQLENHILIRLSDNKKRDISFSSVAEKKEQINIIDDMNRMITGQVTNGDGPLEGVSITVKGTAIGTSTGADGSYSMNVPDNSILIFSSVGFISQEIEIGGRRSIDVRMEQDKRSLSDVVVTALGVKRNVKSLTYSTQSVNTEKLTEAREINLLESLKGKIAGLSIASSGSGVGSDVRIVLRGNRSIDGDSQPLYVVDGVPSGGISDLSADNIASINVLKGANAAALYGSAAQNGAIVIETKRGTTGMHVNLNQTFMLQKPYKLLPYQNVYGQGSGGQYSSSDESSWGPKMDGQMVNTWSLDPADSGKQYAFLPQPNNKLDVFQTGFNETTNLSANMGNEKTQAYFSYTFTDGKGFLPNNDLKRHNIALRVNSKITTKLSFDGKVEYVNQSINNMIREGVGNNNPFQQIYTMPSNIRTEDLKHFEFRDASGSYVQNFWNPSSANGENPYWLLNRDISTNSRSRTIITGSLSYNFSESLKLTTRSSYDGSNSSGDYKYHNGTYNIAVYGLYGVDMSEGSSIYNDFLLSYNKNVTSNWNVKANVGGSASRYRNKSLSSSTGDALLVPNLFALSNTNKPTTSYNPGDKSDIHSLYAFATISWKNAVFLDITGRNDWSSTLPANNRSYFYPSIGLSAVLTDMIPSLPKTISFAKIRASYAKVGNGASPYMLDRTANFYAGGQNGFLQLSSVLPNSNLKPETSISSEIGLDIRFFDNRLGIDFTAYKTNTKDQLFTVALPVGSGASSFFSNGGDVQNKGIEVVVSTTPVRSSNFNWDMNVNFAANRNIVRKISDERPRVIVPSNDPYFKDFVIAQNEPYGQLYGRGWKRDEKGQVIIGSNGIPLLTEGNTVFLGNFSPDWAGGLLNSFTYKNFSLSFVIDHRQGGTVVSPSNAVIDGLGLSERTLQGREGGLVFGKNFFTKDAAVLENNTTNDIQIKAEDFWRYVGGVNTPIAEAFVNSATNTRLRELTLGYSLPKSVVYKMHLAIVKISLVGRNLFFIHRASPYVDPDIMAGTDKTSEGFQSFTPPSSRYYGVNLKIGF